MGQKDPRVIAITAAMPDGTGTTIFQQSLPERFFDVGICEQHAVTFAAGLACAGFRPFVCIYSTFLQRAYDQMVHDVCLQDLPVTFCIDRAGLVGEDGGTHQGVFDMAYLRPIPNMHLLVPRDDNMLARAVAMAPDFGHPLAIRYPRGSAFGVPVDEERCPLPVGRGEILAEGTDMAIFAVGRCAMVALEAARAIGEKLGLSVLVFDPVWVKPLPEEQLLELLARFKAVLTVEEGSLAAGFGSAVLEFACDRGVLGKVVLKRLGVPDRFIEHATQGEQRAALGLDAQGIAEALERLAARANLKAAGREAK